MDQANSAVVSIESVENIGCIESVGNMESIGNIDGIGYTLKVLEILKISKPLAHHKGWKAQVGAGGSAAVALEVES